MKLEVTNPNYAAVVVEVKVLNELKADGGSKKDCDNVLGVPLLGYQSIVSKDTQVGDIGIVFPAETQLSESFVKANSLYRHAELNSDPTKAGYLEDNRRVKAMKFRGHRSDSLFLPLSSLDYTGIDTSKLEVGQVFDAVEGYEICRKYVVKTTGHPFVAQPKKERRVEEKLFPCHFDTANYWRNQDTIPDNAFITVTQKLHGTSIRATNTLVRRKLSFLERIAKRFGVKVQEFEYANVYGSRKVIKDLNDPNQDHYYDFDLWTQEGSKLDGIIPKGYVIYGELIGWAGDNAIQRAYTYRVPYRVAELYIYRITRVNEDGYVTDLGWEQVKEFCSNHGLKHVPELWQGWHFNFDPEAFMNVRYWDEGYIDAVPLEPGKTVDEGVCVRTEGLTPTVLKCKAPEFLAHETKLLDQNVVDMETDDGQVE